jgi:hypothetical protein
MTIGRTQNRIGVSIGRLIVRNEERIEEIVIYKKGDDGLFEFNAIRPFEFHEACPQFMFNFNNRNELLFFDRNGIFAYDYIQGVISDSELYAYNKPMHEIPKLAKMNDTQDKFLVASAHSVYFADI